MAPKTGDDTTDWEDVLWREWRNTPDETWAAFLYAELAARKPTDEGRRKLGPLRDDPLADLSSVAIPGLVGALAGAVAYWAVIVTLDVPVDQDGWIAFAFIGGVACAMLTEALRPARMRRRAARAMPWVELLDKADPRRICPGWPNPRWIRGAATPPHRVGLSSGEFADMPAAPTRAVLPLWQSPPTSADLQAALAHIGLPESLRGLVAPLEDTSLEGLVAGVSRGEGRRYPVRRERTLLALTEIGGEAIVAVQEAVRQRELMRGAADRALRRIAHQTLADVGEAPEELVCPECYTRYAQYQVPLSTGRAVRAVGCRACRRSRGALRHPGPIAAVLDGRDERESWNQDEELRVNWLALARRSGFREPVVFDFDRVEVLSATDEELEHFLVGVTNDTDRARQKSYRRMEVTVAPGYSLSPNTLTLLEEAFGRVNR